MAISTVIPASKPVVRTGVKSTPAPATPTVAELQAQLAALTAQLAQVTPARKSALPTAHENLAVEFDKATGDLIMRVHTRNGKTVDFEPSSSGKSMLVTAVDLAVKLADYSDALGFECSGNLTLYVKNPKPAKKSRK